MGRDAEICLADWGEPFGEGRRVLGLNAAGAAYARFQFFFGVFGPLRLRSGQAQKPGPDTGINLCGVCGGLSLGGLGVVLSHVSKGRSFDFAQDML